MKALWIVSFRPIGKSTINDFYQNLFVDSVKSVNFDITFSLTQFDEQNVSNFVKEKKIKNNLFYKNFTKAKTNYEWSGIFKINFRKLNLKDKSFHIYEMLKKIKINFLIYKIKSMDFDTPKDYIKIKKKFKSIYY